MKISWALFSLLNLAYWLLHRNLLRGLANLSRNRSNPDRPSISILLAARDEEAHLADCLLALMAQDYPTERTQIIVVNDRSTDRTPSILAEIQARYPGRIESLTLETTDSTLSPKKYALTLGMAKAKGDIILTTDADCSMGHHWASAMVEQFAPHTGMVMGLASFYPPVNHSRWVWNIQSLEFLSYSVVAASLVGLGFPVHGNASNIAYRRKAFEEASGFASHGHITSGDDDFLLQSVHKLGNWDVKYSVVKETEVFTAPPYDLRHFWEQRKRWAGKCGFYQPRQVIFLSLIFGYYSLILVALVGGLVSRRLRLMGVIGFLVKTLADYRVMRAGTRFFGKPELMEAFVPTALLHIPLIVGAVLFGSSGQFTWKNQKIHSRMH